MQAPTWPGASEARLDGDHYVVNGRRSGTATAGPRDWCELVVRTDPSVAKHKGLTVLLVDMKTPGVEVRPLRQMTGETEFNEVFFRDVRVPVANVVGKVNQGWDVAIGHADARARHVRRRPADHLSPQHGAADRPGRGQSSATASRRRRIRSSGRSWRSATRKLKIMRVNQMRAFSRINATGVPGPEGSIQKIFWSELNQRLQQIAQELLGPYGQLEGGDDHAIDNGTWSYGYLRARGNTIEAGTSEIQRNIIGHFVLGLPRSY